VECMPKIFLRAPEDRAPICNPSHITKAGFMFVLAHKIPSGYNWTKNKEGSFIGGNLYPIESQVVSHVPSVRKKDKLRFLGSKEIAREQENSPLEVRTSHCDRARTHIRTHQRFPMFFTFFALISMYALIKYSCFDRPKRWCINMEHLVASWSTRTGERKYLRRPDCGAYIHFTFIIPFYLQMFESTVTSVVSVRKPLL
jgi:hypothetical protein